MGEGCKTLPPARPPSPTTPAKTGLVGALAKAGGPGPALWLGLFSFNPTVSHHLCCTCSKRVTLIQHLLGALPTIRHHNCLVCLVGSIIGTPCFTVLCRYCVFYRLKVCGNPALNKSIRAIFRAAFTHFMSLCHSLVILAICQTFSLLLYLLWGSVVSDLAEGSEDG